MIFYSRIFSRKAPYLLNMRMTPSKLGNIKEREYKGNAKRNAKGNKNPIQCYLKGYCSIYEVCRHNLKAKIIHNFDK